MASYPFLKNPRSLVRFLGSVMKDKSIVCVPTREGRVHRMAPAVLGLCFVEAQLCRQSFNTVAFVLKRQA